MPKLTLQFNDKLDAILSELAVKEGLPKTQVVRRAIALLRFVETEKEKGNKLAIADKDDRVLKEIVSP